MSIDQEARYIASAFEADADEQGAFFGKVVIGRKICPNCGEQARLLGDFDSSGTLVKLTTYCICGYHYWEDRAASCPDPGAHEALALLSALNRTHRTFQSKLCETMTVDNDGKLIWVWVAEIESLDQQNDDYVTEGATPLEAVKAALKELESQS